MMKDAISLRCLSRERYIDSLFFDKDISFWPLGKHYENGQIMWNGTFQATFNIVQSASVPFESIKALTLTN